MVSLVDEQRKLKEKPMDLYYDYQPLYIYATTVLFWLLTLVWSKDDLVNLLLKGIFVLLAVAGTILSLNQLGFIIHV
jgi:hypothetical protein